MARRRARILLALLLAAGLLVACGDDDGGTVREEGAASGTASATGAGSGSGTEAATGVAPPVELEGTVTNHGVADVPGDSFDLEADDFYFAPTFLRVPGGGSVAIEVVNEGVAPHTFTIEEQDIDLVLQPGDRQQVEVELPTEGHLAFVCRFHLAQGMQGAFFTA